MFRGLSIGHAAEIVELQPTAIDVEPERTLECGGYPSWGKLHATNKSRGVGSLESV